MKMLAVSKLLVDVEIDDIVKSAEELCSKINITLDYEDPVYASRRDVTTSSGPCEFCESLKTTSVPMLFDDLERRFSSENTTILAALEALDASKPTYLDFNTVSVLVAKYGDCLQIDSALL